MNRRDFIKGSISLSFAGLLAQLFPLKVLAKTAVCSFRGRLYKGNRSGQILESRDAGASWQQLADFGPSSPVDEIRADRDQLYAVLETLPGGHRFSLKSTDGRTWWTDEYAPPGPRRARDA